MHPGPDYEGIEDSGIVLIDRMKCRERALQIFRVEPSTHSEHGAVDVFHVRREIARLPVVVIGIVFDLVVPKRALALEILF